MEERLDLKMEEGAMIKECRHPWELEKARKRPRAPSTNQLCPQLDVSSMSPVFNL